MLLCSIAQKLVHYTGCEKKKLDVKMQMGLVEIGECSLLVSHGNLHLADAG